MKIDIDYLSKLLKLFINSNRSHISIPYLIDNGIKVESIEGVSGVDDCFLFHFQLMMENALISDLEFNSYDLAKMGLILDVSGGPLIVGQPIRLTQNGHDFASALNNREVLEKLKSELKDAPFKVVFEGSQKLIQHYLKKKLDNLVSE